MNERPEIPDSLIQQQFKRKLPIVEPRVDVIVINSRGFSNPGWVKKCFNSIKSQSYSKIGIITVGNLGRKYTIGQCWNAAIARSSAKYVIFVGDDDMIAPTLIHTLVNAIKQARQLDSEVVGASSFMTMMDADDKYLGLMPNPFTGLFDREYLSRNRFDESLKNNVDTEILNRYNAAGKRIAKVSHYYGYF